MNGRCLSALDGNVLCRRRHITVHRQFFYKIGSRKELLFDLPVFPSGHVLIHFISQDIRAGYIECNPRYDPVLTCLNDLRRTISFCFDLHIERHRITGSGHHSLVSRPAPDQHIFCYRNILTEHKSNRIHDHLLAGKRITVPAPRDRYAAAGNHLQINVQVVRICNCKCIDLLLCIPFQFQFRSF